MIGERLAEIRKDHGDTQKSLAVKLNVVHFTVSSWEQGKSEPNHDMLVKICRLYGISSDYLLGLSDTNPFDLRTRSVSLDKDDLTILKNVEAYLRWRHLHCK